MRPNQGKGRKGAGREEEAGGGGRGLLRSTEEDVFPPVAMLTHSHCMMTWELCIPQFQQMVLKALPL